MFAVNIEEPPMFALHDEADSLLTANCGLFKFSLTALPPSVSTRHLPVARLVSVPPHHRAYF
jgi:hypothetical protein